MVQYIFKLDLVHPDGPLPELENNLWDPPKSASKTHRFGSKHFSLLIRQKFDHILHLIFYAIYAVFIFILFVFGLEIENVMRDYHPNEIKFKTLFILQIVLVFQFH